MNWFKLIEWPLLLLHVGVLCSVEVLICISSESHFISLYASTSHNYIHIPSSHPLIGCCLGEALAYARKHADDIECDGDALNRGLFSISRMRTPTSNSIASINLYEYLDRIWIWSAAPKRHLGAWLINWKCARHCEFARIWRKSSILLFVGLHRDALAMSFPMIFMAATYYIFRAHENVHKSQNTHSHTNPTQFFINSSADYWPTLTLIYLCSFFYRAVLDFMTSWW